MPGRLIVSRSTNSTLGCNSQAPHLLLITDTAAAATEHRALHCRTSTTHTHTLPRTFHWSGSLLFFFPLLYESTADVILCTLSISVMNIWEAY